MIVGEANLLRVSLPCSCPAFYQNKLPAPTCTLVSGFVRAFCLRNWLHLRQFLKIFTILSTNLNLLHLVQEKASNTLPESLGRWLQPRKKEVGDLRKLSSQKTEQWKRPELKQFQPKVAT